MSVGRPKQDHCVAWRHTDSQIQRQMAFL